MQEREYKFTLTEENKSKVEQFLKLLNIDVDIVEAENTLEQKEWPQDGNHYYFIVSEGLIDDTYFIVGDELASERRLSIGNCFKTREEAKFEVERLKVIAEMKKFAEPEDRKWDGEIEHWCVLYDCSTISIQFLGKTDFKYDGIYFESEEKARECVKAVGEDRIKKYYLQIKK